MEPVTVTQLNEYIKAKLETDPALSHVTVKGEISNFKSHYTGHLYMSLKDEGGVIRAIMFSSSAVKLKFVPENGMKVICEGRVSSYVKDGQYQLYIFDMQPDGVGALAVAFEQLKRKLEQEGIFDRAHKKPIPRYPMSVGIITSPTGAAVRDMINVSGRRFPLARLVLFPCLVQGDGAPAQLVSGIRFFNERHPVDVIIIGRGGGSLEELWAFNDENLARAIYNSRIPVISAVGHETDFSISDFAADLRAPTPSAAAELALPETGEVKRRLGNVTDRMALVTEARIKSYRDKLGHLASSRALSGISVLIDDKRAGILGLGREMELKFEARFAEKKAEMMKNAAKLEALSPIAVMTRGYSAVFREDGSPVKSAKALKKNEKVTLRFAEGRADAVITDTD